MLGLLVRVFVVGRQLLLSPFTGLFDLVGERGHVARGTGIVE